MKLYEIAEQFRRLDEIELESDNDINAFGVLCMELQGNIVEKIDNCCRVLHNSEYESNALKSEIDRLSSKKIAIDNKIFNLKSYMKFQMESIGINKVKSDIFSVSIQNNPQSVEIYGAIEDIPVEFQRITIEGNRTAIKKSLLSGTEITGCKLVQTQSLRIK